MTPKGWAQCRALKKHLDEAVTHDGCEHVMDRIELVVVSPLMRALETAVGALGGDDKSCDLARLEARLRADALANGDRGRSTRARRHRHAQRGDSRAARAEGAQVSRVRAVPGTRRREPVRSETANREYAAAFPGVDFSEITDEEDTAWER